MNQLYSPISRTEIECTPYRIGDLIEFKHPFGELCFTSAALVEWPESEKTIPSLEGADIRATVRSIAWRKRVLGESRLLICTGAEQIDIEVKAEGRFECKTFAQLLAHRRALTLDQCAVITLDNLQHMHEDGTGMPDIRYITFGDSGVYARALVPGQGEIIPDDPGYSFGFDHSKCHYLYSYLLDERLIRYQNSRSKPEITVKGFLETSKLRANTGTSSSKVFVVRKYEAPEIDQYVTPILEELGSKLRIDISPVWGHPHVERIDERIFNSIRNSAAIILVIDDQNFNVGLEAGYAIALGKPILAIRRKPEPYRALPFDIYSLNCWDYELDSDGLAKLRDILEGRLRCCVPALNAE